MSAAAELIGARVVATLDAGEAVGLVLLGPDGSLWHTLRFDEGGRASPALVRLGGSGAAIAVRVGDESAPGLPPAGVPRRALGPGTAADARPERAKGKGWAPGATYTCAGCGEPVSPKVAPKNPERVFHRSCAVRVSNAARRGAKAEGAREGAALSLSADPRPACAHGEWEIECLVGGRDRYTCKRCGHVEERPGMRDGGPWAKRGRAVIPAGRG